MHFDDGDPSWLDVESDEEADALMAEADFLHGEFNFKAEDQTEININEKLRKGDVGFVSIMGFYIWQFHWRKTWQS